MKKKLLFAVAMMLAAVGAKAQTDVTSTYLTNADFSQGTPVTVGVCTYVKDKDGNHTEYANLVPVDGWTAVESKDGKAGGLFAIGGGAWLGGTGFTAPLTDSDGNTGVNVLGIVTCWGATVLYTQDLKQALPVGTYTLVIGAYNSAYGSNGTNAIKNNLIGFVETGGATHYATTSKYPTNTWKYEFITFTLTEETEGYISLGYTGDGGSAGLPHLFLSGLTLFEGEVDAEAYEAAKAAAREAKEAKVNWENAKAAAETALADEDYASVMGEDRTNLETEVGKAEPTTTEGYNDAAEALNTATAAFKAAKASFDELAEINAVAAKLGLDELSAESGAEAIEKAHVQNVAVYNKVIEDYTFPVTLGSWTTTGKSKQEKSQHWDGTSTSTYYEPDQWSAASVDWKMAQTLAGLPAGDYVLMAAGRRSGDVTMTMSAAGESVSTFPNADSGFGVDTSGAPNFSDEGTYANTIGRGWQWRYVPFTLTEAGDVVIEVTAKAPSTNQWCSICDFKLIAKPEAETAIAKAELLAAINEANEVDTDFNVGEGVFQKVPSSAEDFLSIIGAAQETYDDPDATLEVVEATTEAVKQAIDDFANAPLNAPEADNLYAITIVTDGHPYYGNAIVAGNGATSANNPTGYIYNVRGETPYLAQAFTFTSAEDAENPNDYYISIELPEGTVYLTNGTNNGSAADWAPSQIQGTTDSSAKMAFRIAASPTVEGAFNIYNPATGYKVIAQNGGNIYTDDTQQQNGEFTLADPTVTEVATAIAAGKFATRIYPFVPQPISGVTFYTCEGANDKVLVLDEVTELAANTPYILYAESDVDVIEKGNSIAGEATYTAGWLTGTFTSVDIPVGSYVLQTLDGTQAFYKVEVGETAYKATPFRAYLSIPEEEEQGEVKAYTLGGIATAINTLEALTSGNFEGIYNAAGTKLNRMEKGVNIIRMNDGSSRKVMIK